MTKPNTPLPEDHYQKIRKEVPGARWPQIVSEINKIRDEALENQRRELAKKIQGLPLLDGNFIGEKAKENQLISEIAALSFKNKVLLALLEKSSE